ncbi:MAG: hypothetical protein M4579_004263 [Chaenotheca gracillima]|nr:MAG: hypothetical protein M4579_004263 [Chaenotheca gracillima]
MGLSTVQVQSEYVDTSVDEQEAGYLLNRSRIHWLRTGLTLLVLAISLTITGCLAHSLHIFHETNVAPGWWLPLWPQDVNTRPTITLLGVSSAIAFLSLILSVASVIPSPYPRTTLLNGLAALASLVGLVLSIVGVAYYGARSGDANPATLQNWSCSFSEISAPANFGRVCTENRVGINLSILLIVLQILLVGLAGAGFWAQKRMQRMRATMQEVKLSDRPST